MFAVLTNAAEVAIACVSYTQLLEQHRSLMTDVLRKVKSLREWRTKLGCARVDLAMTKSNLSTLPADLHPLLHTITICSDRHQYRDSHSVQARTVPSY